MSSRASLQSPTVTHIESSTSSFSLTAATPQPSVHGPGMGASYTSYSSLQTSFASLGIANSGLFPIIPGLPTSILASLSLLPASSTLTYAFSALVSSAPDLESISDEAVFASTPHGDSLFSNVPLSTAGVSAQISSIGFTPQSADGSHTLSPLSSVYSAGSPYPRVSPSSLSTSLSPLVPTAVPVVNSFRYPGCYGSFAGFPTFFQADDSPPMSAEVYTIACRNYAYAGLFAS